MPSLLPTGGDEFRQQLLAIDRSYLVALRSTPYTMRPALPQALFVLCESLPVVAVAVVINLAVLVFLFRFVVRVIWRYGGDPGGGTFAGAEVLRGV
jgi:hypothetical protein